MEENRLYHLTSQNLYVRMTPYIRTEKLSNNSQGLQHSQYDTVSIGFQELSKILFAVEAVF